MVEPGDDFQPPHCPNSHCDFHCNPRGWRFKRDGHHLRRFDGRRIRRYRCSHCRRSFCTQTFSPTYWLKRPDLLNPILHGSLSCSALRQVARALPASPATVQLQVERLGRHTLLFHEQHRPSGAPQEPLVLDGFETFAFSQYWISHLNTVVGAASHFEYAATVSELRRKGRMTRRQRRRRAELETSHGRPDPRSVQQGVEEALALVVPPGAEAVVRSDEHRQYPRALAALTDRRFRHEVTSSKAPRTPANPLFPVNLLHLLLRHGGANHKRETIAFSKRDQGMVWREAIHRVFRNYVKHVSERKRHGTPAQRLGLFHRPLTWDQVLEQRIFPSRMALPRPLDSYYGGRIPTRQLPRARAHTLRYAF
jgi:transposase-like protein